MIRALALAILATGCSYTYVGVVETERPVEWSRCGGYYRTVTRCDAVVGPWPFTTISYPNCRTGDP